MYPFRVPRLVGQTNKPNRLARGYHFFAYETIIADDYDTVLFQSHSQIRHLADLSIIG